MKKYILDVYTKRNEVMLSKLLREATDDSEDELGRLEWQIDNSDTDVLVSDLVAVAVYRPSMEALDKYNDGIAFYSGDDLVEKLEKLMIATETQNNVFAGWGIKSYVVPVLYRSFIMNGLPLRVLGTVFNTYPFEDRDTIDLNNMYNFNGQMSTVRARNRYSLEETAYAYGYENAFEEDIDPSPENILRRRIKLQRFLFDLRGLSWE